MSSFTRKMLPAVALAAMLSAPLAQAQISDQDHGAHHPDGATAQTQSPAGAEQAAPGGQPGMMMGMDQMRSMMGAPDGQAGTMTMMHRMMMGQPGGMGLPFEHVEGRIAFLKTEIKITDAQAQPWNAFADALRANAKAHQAMREQMVRSGIPAAWPDRLAVQQRMLTMRLNGLKSIEAAAKPLYAVLSDEQKALADQLLAGPMGMM